MNRVSTLQNFFLNSQKNLSTLTDFCFMLNSQSYNIPDFSMSLFFILICFLPQSFQVPPYYHLDMLNCPFVRSHHIYTDISMLSYHIRTWGMASDKAHKAHKHLSIHTWLAKVLKHLHCNFSCKTKLLLHICLTLLYKNVQKW